MMIYLCDENGLVIEGNTIYEIDLSCYECLGEEERKRYFGEGHEVRKRVPAETESPQRTLNPASYSIHANK